MMQNIYSSSAVFTALDYSVADMQRLHLQQWFTYIGCWFCYGRACHIFLTITDVHARLYNICILHLHCVHFLILERLFNNL